MLFRARQHLLVNKLQPLRKKSARIFKHSGWIRSKSLFSVRLRKNTDQKNSKYRCLLSSEPFTWLWKIEFLSTMFISNFLEKFFVKFTKTFVPRVSVHCSSWCSLYSIITFSFALYVIYNLFRMTSLKKQRNKWKLNLSENYLGLFW